MGSVVYSNYSVRVEVLPSPPVAFILGGTNVFLARGNVSALALDGHRSYDPDQPAGALRYRACWPVSAMLLVIFTKSFCKISFCNINILIS